MKVAQLLEVKRDESETVHVRRRSDINRAVASMSMAVSIDFTAETDNQQHKNWTVDLIDKQYDKLRTILKKHTRRKVSSLGSGFMSSGFDHRNQLEKLKACLDEMADYFDPEKQDVPWGWTIGLEDEAWLFS
jgi:hypothetical protein